VLRNFALVDRFGNREVRVRAAFVPAVPDFRRAHVVCGIDYAGAHGFSPEFKTPHVSAPDGEVVPTAVNRPFWIRACETTRLPGSIVWIFAFNLFVMSAHSAYFRAETARPIRRLCGPLRRMRWPGEELSAQESCVRGDCSPRGFLFCSQGEPLIDFTSFRPKGSFRLWCAPVWNLKFAPKSDTPVKSLTTNSRVIPRHVGESAV